MNMTSVESSSRSRSSSSNNSNSNPRQIPFKTNNDDKVESAVGGSSSALHVSVVSVSTDSDAVGVDGIAVYGRQNSSSCLSATSSSDSKSSNIQKKVSHGFHTQVQTTAKNSTTTTVTEGGEQWKLMTTTTTQQQEVQITSKARKRKRDTNKSPNHQHQHLSPSMSLSSSSSSSSDEEVDETKQQREAVHIVPASSSSVAAKSPKETIAESSSTPPATDEKMGRIEISPAVATDGTVTNNDSSTKNGTSSTSSSLINSNEHHHHSTASTSTSHQSNQQKQQSHHPNQQQQQQQQHQSQEQPQQHNNSPPQQQHHHHQVHHHHQPEGWRVKLYRLNADGSWDDCGTGRIMCLYKPSPAKPASPTASSLAQGAGTAMNSADTSTGATSSSININSNNTASSTGTTAATGQLSNNNSSTPAAAMGDAYVYQELGEPTLCMHSEVSGTATGTAHMPRILLRTRILLRDAYQRQGDNIITWCEPYLEEGNPAQGVDLALSFQDNAGCLDIWRQITDVQSKAAHYFRRANTGGSGGGGGGGGGVGNNIGPPGGGVVVGGGCSSTHDTTSSSTSSSSNASANNENRSWGTRGGDNSNNNNNNVDSNSNNNNNGNSVADVAHAVAAAHHENLQRQQQQEMWVSVASEASSQHHHLDHHHQNSFMGHDPQHFGEDSVIGGGGIEGVSGGGFAAHDGGSNSNTPTSGGANNPQVSPQLPNPPTLANLEEIADTIAAVQHIQQRESLAMYISQNECSYLKSLLSLFPSAESRGDYGSLATLAACVKTILLLNDPSIIELIVSDELIFEDVCSTLEYDPDLRDKANHRWFLRERAKFRTVALMEDEELIAAIHRSFRVNYLRDTLLRPTMDESSLSTLSSLQTFTHADVVKGVTMSPSGTDDKGELLKDSYLAKVIRILGRELRAICEMEWKELETSSPGAEVDALLPEKQLDSAKDPSTIVASGKYPQAQKLSTIWKQHLAPQDGSLASRRLRRRGALSFLRELFNMVRISLQQSDKDDFFAVLVSMEVDLAYGDGGSSSEKLNSSSANPGSNDGTANLGKHPNPVNLLSLLGTVLSDPSTDVTEKGSVLEIIAGIAMHDPSLIRRRCLDFYVKWKKERHFGDPDIEKLTPSRPSPNQQKQIIFRCPPNDLLASLLFLLAVETDAGVLLQVSEIMRIILDTDMMGDHAPMGNGFADEAEGVPQGNHNQTQEQHAHHGPLTSSTDQNQFLSMYYDQYVQWLAAPFGYTIFHPVRRVPYSLLSGKVESPRLRKMIERFSKGATDPLLTLVSPCAIRHSFAVELLSFCVRAHLYRMKCYLLRSRVLDNVLKLLRPPTLARNTSGDRCLKLATLRFLRAILSVNDEFYHRAIIQDDLFAPVFETFRANPVGDNLVSSSIVEMCDFIHTENIRSLIDYIVTKHLAVTRSENPIPSLEDVSSPYVSTLTTLRQAYEKNLRETEKSQSGDSKTESLSDAERHSRYFPGSSAAGTARVVMNEKALEDQRKFREVDQEESYFESDDDEGTAPPPTVPPAVDEVVAQEESDLRRTPRMFSLSPSPVLHSAPRLLEGNPSNSTNKEAGLGERDVIRENSENILAET